MPTGPDIDFGHLDGFDGTMVSGWAFRGGAGFCNVDIWLDGQLVGTVPADQYRADLEAAGMAAGCCAFLFQLPTTALTGSPQTLSVRLADGGPELRGSPVEIIGAGGAALPASPDDRPLLIPDLRHRAVPHTPIANGPNLLAPGIWIEAVEGTAGAGVYACGIFEGFRFSRLGDALPGIRLRVPIADSHLRLFQELPPLRCLIAGPLTLSFALLRQESDASRVIRLSVGFVEGERFTAVWTHTLRRMVTGLQEHDVRLDPEPFNQVMQQSRDGRAKAVLALDFHGGVDAVVSPLHVAFGDARQDPADEPLRDFEDPALREQWRDIAEAMSRPPASPVTGEWACRDILNVAEIVVPVFNAPTAVAECLSALREHTTVPHLLTLVDDGSFSETAALLDRAALASPWCRVLHAACTEGRTVAVNRAVTSSAGEVVVILDSDTVVTPGWLDGLLECLKASPDTMMAGPMSNAAGWQSLPRAKEGAGWAINRLKRGETPRDRARLLRAVSSRAFPEVPLLDGFCLAIRRPLFDAIGLFDELGFPEGLGEERDFCLRAADADFRMRVADHVYVHRRTPRGLAEEQRAALQARADGLLNARYGQARLTRLDEAMARCTALAELRRRFTAALSTDGVAA